MFVGSLMYFLFVFQFLKPMVWALYLGSVLVGFGAAILWAAQGNFLTINSDSETIARNSGIFWALLQCSLLFGNMYSYFVFQGEVHVTNSQRTKLFIALSAAGLLGSFLLLFLRRRRTPTDPELMALNDSITTTAQPDTPLTALKKAFELMKTKDMLLLSVAFAYTGLELTFFSGVYGSCISNTAAFGTKANGYLGISGIFIGVGEILGGCLFGLLGKKSNAHGRDPIVVLGYLVQMGAFYLIFLNLPDESPINKSLHATYMGPNEYVAILCSFLLGFGDSSFNTQIYSLVGHLYSSESAPAFALFKFVQSVAAAVAFYYSDVLILQWQLLILVVFASAATLCFNWVEWKSTNMGHSDYKPIGEEES